MNVVVIAKTNSCILCLFAHVVELFGAPVPVIKIQRPDGDWPTALRRSANEELHAQRVSGIQNYVEVTNHKVHRMVRADATQSCLLDGVTKFVRFVIVVTCRFHFAIPCGSDLCERTGKVFWQLLTKTIKLQSDRTVKRPSRQAWRAHQGRSCYSNRGLQKRSTRSDTHAAFTPWGLFSVFNYSLHIEVTKQVIKVVIKYNQSMDSTTKTLSMNDPTDLATSGRARIALPGLVASAGEQASRRFLEFFAAQIRNPHTRRAYARTSACFFAWMGEVGVTSLSGIQPLHVASWIELEGRKVSAPSVKQRLAALRHLFDWLVMGQVIPANPAASVRGPRYVVRAGKTPVLEAEETRALLESIDTSTVIGLRDRALIALMLYSFARIGAALAMKVEDVFTQNRRLWVRLHEKGGKDHAMPCHHVLEQALLAYLEGSALGNTPKEPLFRTLGRGARQLTRTPLPQANAHAMIRRRALAAGIPTKIGNHSFRATGITAYLKNGGTLEKAAAMANHASTRTTQLYDRRREEMSLNEVERILI